MDCCNSEEIERERILAIINEEKILAKELQDPLLSAKLTEIEVKIKGGQFAD